MWKFLKNFIFYLSMMLTLQSCFTPKTLVDLRDKVFGVEGDAGAGDDSSTTGNTFTLSRLLSSTYDGFCFVDTETKEFCWGKLYTSDDQAITYAKEFSGPVAVKSALRGKTIKKIKMAEESTCAIASDDKLYCWGSGNHGSIGSVEFQYGRAIPAAVDTSGVLAGKTIIDFSVSQNNTCAIDSDHKAYCWGKNNVGQLGNGTLIGSNVPVAVSLGGVTVNKIEIGDETICALGDDGLVYCWGKNSGGQLGNGTLINSSVPVQVDFSALAPGLTATTLEMSFEKGCIIASDSKLYCWGSASSNIGNGSGINHTTPVLIDGGAINALTIKSLYVDDLGLTCVIASDDYAYCWGANGNGELGKGDTVNSDLPVAVNLVGSLVSGFKSMALYRDKVCAISMTNLVYCWGKGGIGNGDPESAPDTYDDVLTPSAVDTSGVMSGKVITSIIVNDPTTCALDSTGEAYCWGPVGILGNGDGRGSNSPVLVSKAGGLSGSSFTALTSSPNMTCGLTDDNNVYCWGSQGSVSGSGSRYDQLLPMPIYNNSFSNELITDLYFSYKDELGEYCIQRNNGDVYCHDNEERKMFYKFSFGSIKIKKLVYSDYIDAFCALTTTSKIYCWGRSYDSFLNISGEASASPIALDVPGLLSGKTVKDIGIGNEHACALTEDNQVYCWGSSSNGQLGDGTFNVSQAPVAVDVSGVLNGKIIKSLFVRYRNTCVITDEDLPYCWGEGAIGALGDGTTADSAYPVAVTMPMGVTVKKMHMEIGGSNICFISNTDEVYCWGPGASGLLGNGVAALSSVPVKVVMPGSLTVKSLGMSASFACAITSDDQVACWGAGTDGQLGHGASPAVSVPVVVSNLTGKVVDQISTTQDSACALTTEDEVYCWGYGGGGQLGDGLQNFGSNVPVEISYTP